MADNVSLFANDPFINLDFSCDDIFFEPTNMVLLKESSKDTPSSSTQPVHLSPEQLAIELDAICTDCVNATSLSLSQSRECVERHYQPGKRISLIPRFSGKSIRNVFSSSPTDTSDMPDVLTVTYKDRSTDYRFNKRWSNETWSDTFHFMRQEVQSLVEKWFTASSITGEPFDPSSLKTLLENVTKGVVQKSAISAGFPAFPTFSRLAILHSSLNSVLRGQEHHLRRLIKVAPNQQLFARFQVPTVNPYPIPRTATLIPRSSTGAGVTSGPNLNRQQMYNLKSLVFGPGLNTLSVDVKMNLLSSNLKGSLYHDIIRNPTATLFSELRRYVLTGPELIDFVFREDHRDLAKYRCNSCRISVPAPTKDGMFQHLCNATTMIAEEFGFEVLPGAIKIDSWVPLDVATSNYVREFLGLVAPSSHKTTDNVIDLGLETLTMKTTHVSSAKEKQREQRIRDAAKDAAISERDRERRRYNR